MTCDHCETAPRHTLRRKTGPGQWQTLGKACEGHLADLVSEQQPESAGLQVIPFNKRDWPV